jgi:2-C-methyl-D-erythritol 2,4-cyclodiphosphate synthase
VSGRVGIGFDAHPFDPGRPLRLGGIEFDGSPGLAVHSDGDALLHAVTDAVLGAAGLGSIGEHFSDRDPALAGADSSRFLAHAARLASERGWRIANLDAVVIAEAPKIAPLASRMRARIGDLLGLPVDRVSVRGTSSNGLGFSGRGEGIAAMAVALLEPKEP